MRPPTPLLSFSPKHSLQQPFYSLLDDINVSTTRSIKLGPQGSLANFTIFRAFLQATKAFTLFPPLAAH